MRVDVSLVNRLDGVLEGLGKSARGVRGAVVSDQNGLPIASSFPEGPDISVVAAMSTLITQSAKSVFDWMQLSDPEILIVEGKEVNMVAVAIPGASSSLLVVTEKVANLGLVKLEIRRAAREIATALGTGSPERARISELFILSHGGLLIRHYSDTLRTDDDRDILAGMLSAVQSFVKQTLASKAGALEEMRYGSRSICFVRGTHTVGAMVAEDGDTEAARYVVFDALRDFEEKYERPLKDWTGDVHDFPGIDECFTKLVHG